MKIDPKQGFKMTDAIGLREVVPNSCLPERCREFNIHTGKLCRVDVEIFIQKMKLNITQVVLKVPCKM